VITPQLTIHGKGEPIVWLHGMLNSVESDSVYSLVDQYELAKYRQVSRYNYCNQSTSGNYTWPFLAGELIQVLNDQKIDRAVLAGLSMGSGTIVHAATQFPERVKAMILVTPPPAWEVRNKIKAVYRKIAQRTNPDSIPEMIKRLVSLTQDPPSYFEQVHPGTQQKLIEHRLSFEPGYYTRIYLDGAESDFPTREQISEISVPCLIIAYPDDVNHPFATALELNSLIRNSELIVVKNYTEHKELQAKVHDFLKQLEN